MGDFNESQSDLIRIMGEVADGNLDVDVPYQERSDAIGDMARAVAVFKAQAIRVTALETEMEVRSDEAMIVAQTDALTGLANRSLFHKRLEEALAHSDRTGHDVGVMLLDLDHFKHVNDTLGHPVGDALLREVAQRLLDSCRCTDTVARLGGDEFAIIVTNMSDGNRIDALADRIIWTLSDPFCVEDKIVLSGASVGLTVFPSDYGDSDHLLRNADIALYQAKAQGRGTFKIFDRKLNAEVSERRSIEEDLVKAIEVDDQLVLYYQPQLDIATGALIGAEVLLRWQHPERGMVMPPQFIPIAEMSRLIVPLGEKVLRETCMQAKAWQDMGLEPISFAVNKSPLEFKHQDMLGGVRSALEESELAPRWLELEITEGAAMDKSCVSLLTDLKKIGVQLAIDDFGLGYSSLSRLKDFPVDRLKIDKSFVMSLDTEPDRKAICSAVVTLGTNLGLRVVAEGVETTAELAIIREMGCHDLQGYLCARPMPAKEFERFQRCHNAAGWIAGGLAIAS